MSSDLCHSYIAYSNICSGRIADFYTFIYRHQPFEGLLKVYKRLTVSLTIERFSYDLEKKTREQNRNNKRTEIERFAIGLSNGYKRARLLVS